MNPLYDPQSYGQNMANPYSAVMSALSMQNPAIASQFNSFAQNFQQTVNMNPEMYCRQLMASGRLPQSDFNRGVQMANMVLGRR